MQNCNLARSFQFLRLGTHLNRLKTQTTNKLSVTTLLGNPKGPVQLGNPKTCFEVKVCLFLFMSVFEIVCRDTEVLKTVSFR